MVDSLLKKPFRKSNDNVNRIYHIINSRAAYQAAMGLGRTLPPVVGYALADLLSGLMSRMPHLALVRAVRLNQWIVHDRQVDSRQLDRLVRETLRSAARAVYDFAHWKDHPQVLKKVVRVEESFRQVAEKARRREHGVILALPHMTNPDLLGWVSAPLFGRLTAIAPNRLMEGYQVQNQLRRQVGIEVIPGSLEAVRTALARLREGEAVVFGVDRPYADSAFRPRFFGLPAALPVAHVRVALKLDLPIYVVGAALKEDKQISLWATEYRLHRLPNPQEEILVNAERVLEVVMDNIRQYPVQWNMTFPVWPDWMERVP
ncbi:hypothetical protein ANT_27210 [Anaerolinea thermophila UNI-1]|uniref:Acyltransferase n=1 Tax=Anaerolinea thermophila (strain DSM 14523 / JCM 11388 / NBRC 100420 / UNI-1) TaxID=926569 RepID=E8N0J8_ANATU|nr:hypothetical protein ANT_27210 [Anaerolinea thermophila UNI-1]